MISLQAHYLILLGEVDMKVWDGSAKHTADRAWDFVVKKVMQPIEARMSPRIPDIIYEHSERTEGMI